MILVSISRTYKNNLQEHLLNWCLSQSTSLHIPQIQKSTNHTKLNSFANLIHYTFSKYTPLFFRVCTIALVHRVATNSTLREHQFTYDFIRKPWTVQFPGKYKFTFAYPLPMQTVRRTICTNVHYRVSYR